MRTHIKKLFALTGALTIALGTLYAQNKEYDDLYFTPNDRVKVKKVDAEDRVVLNSREVQQLAANPVENYSAKNVNPEFIARYQAPSEEYSSDSDYAEGEYFNENYNYNTSNVSHNNADVAIRDRYGNTAYFDDFSDVYWSDPFYYEGSIFDPFYSPHRYGRYGYNSYYGHRPFRSGWSLSFGFGNTWGMRHGWHSGFSFGYGWGSGYYDPFYSPYYDPFYSPYYGSYYGYGYGYPYRNNIVVINNYESRSDRTIKRGPGTSRSGSLVTNNRSRSVSTDENISTGRSSSTSRVATSSAYNSRTSRENLDAQSRYYRRSREAVTNETNATAPTTSRTYDSRSRSSSNYSTDSRSSTRSRSSYTRPSNSNSNSRSSYNRSESNSRTYSTPSRSRSNNSYTPSRSSRSSSYSAPSRSSSRSSYSSGSSSRSSSGSRSSSSSSRSRRGN